MGKRSFRLSAMAKFSFLMRCVGSRRDIVIIAKEVLRSRMAGRRFLSSGLDILSCRRVLVLMMVEECSLIFSEHELRDEL